MLRTFSDIDGQTVMVAQGQKRDLLFVINIIKARPCIKKISEHAECSALPKTLLQVVLQRAYPLQPYGHDSLPDYFNKANQVSDLLIRSGSAVT